MISAGREAAIEARHSSSIASALRAGIDDRDVERGGIGRRRFSVVVGIRRGPAAGTAPRTCAEITSEASSANRVAGTRRSVQAARARPSARIALLLAEERVLGVAARRRRACRGAPWRTARQLVVEVAQEPGGHPGRVDRLGGHELVLDALDEDRRGQRRLRRDGRRGKRVLAAGTIMCSGDQRRSDARRAAGSGRSRVHRGRRPAQRARQRRRDIGFSAAGLEEVRVAAPRWWGADEQRLGVAEQAPVGGEEAQSSAMRRVPPPSDELARAALVLPAPPAPAMQTPWPVARDGRRVDHRRAARGPRRGRAAAGRSYEQLARAVDAEGVALARTWTFGPSRCSVVAV